MLKTCNEHGSFTALLASDVRRYYRVDPDIDSIPGCCGPGQHCGDQVENHSCNLLIEITQSCNLTCPACYAGSSPGHKTFMTLEQFEQTLEGLLEMGKAGADLLQLSGGEPTIHPQFFKFIEMALARGIKQVYINTNGLYLASKPDFARRLADFGPRVSVYLQFDGFDSATHKLLRGRDLGKQKIQAMENCEKLGINTVPVMTLTRGINEHEVGAFLDYAQSMTASVRKVMIQPAIYSGRFDNPKHAERLTLADVINLISKQSEVFTEDDFTPIPCSDPNCFSMAAAIRTPAGLIPVSRFLPRYKDWANDGISQLITAVSDTFDSAGSFSGLLQKVVEASAFADMSDEVVDEMLDLVASLPAEPGSHNSNDWNPLFAIGIKPFMDAYTYDQDRIDKCCVHIISAQGKPVSFCEYNAINRPAGRL